MFRILISTCALLLHIVAMSTTQVAYAQLSSVTGSEHLLEGVLKPVQNVDVATTEVGIVREICVKNGDRVTRGQPIAILDSEALQAQLLVKRAEAAARGKLLQAEAEAKLQKAKFARLVEMQNSNSAHRLEVERAEADLEIAHGRLSNEQDQIRILELDLERVEKLIEERTVRAPCDGIVVDIYKEVGEYVASNSPNLVRLVDIRQLKATFSLTESDLRGIAVGKPMTLELNGGKRIQGIIDFIPPVADPTTSWFMISVTIENQDEKIIGSRCQRVQ